VVEEECSVRKGRNGNAVQKLTKCRMWQPNRPSQHAIKMMQAEKERQQVENRLLPGKRKREREKERERERERKRERERDYPQACVCLVPAHSKTGFKVL
jgi:hypothetical protein